MQTTPLIQYAEFSIVDIRVGKIISAVLFPEAKKPAYKLTIDFGPEIGIKHSSAQITTRYSINDLTDTLIIAVVNFPPKKIASFLSEVLVLGVNDNEENVVLLRPDKDALIGNRIY
jgi:tRNA-binding protein